MLGRAPLADVADGARDQGAVVGLERAQADLDRELRAVLAAAVQLEPGSHRPHSRVREEAAPMGPVTAALPIGHQQLDALTDELGTWVAEETLGLNVDQLDRAVGVDDHHRVRGRLEQRAKPGVGALAIADVAHGRGDETATLGIEGGEADLGGKLAPVLAATEELDADAHGPRPRIDDVLGSALAMVVVESCGNQDLDGLPDQLFVAVPEEGGRLVVHEDDASRVVRADQRVGRRVQQCARGERVDACSRGRHDCGGLARPVTVALLALGRSETPLYNEVRR